MPVESAKSQAVENALPEELQPTYRRMVQEYEFLTHVRYGRGYVAYEILGQMVLSGWRPSAEPHEASHLAGPNG